MDNCSLKFAFVFKTQQLYTYFTRLTLLKKLYVVVVVVVFSPGKQSDKVCSSSKDERKSYGFERTALDFFCLMNRVILVYYC